MLFHLHTFMIEQCVSMCVLIIAHIAFVFCPPCFVHFEFNAYIYELSFIHFAPYTIKSVVP
jgi:hypothetical protein